MEQDSPYKSIITSGILLGIGMGGFFDGIVLHQILQWHHLLTSAGYPDNSLENLKLNTLADGLFHAVTWIFTGLGLIGLWRTLEHKGAMNSAGVLIGAFFVGWRLFNLVEGIIDHHILGIHHVRSGPDETFWDIAFLIWGAVMLVGGSLLIRATILKITHSSR